MATRQVRIAQRQSHQRLKRQAAAQASAAEHLVKLADALHAGGRPEAARCLVGVALRFRVNAICLSAQAEALNRRKGLLV
jgi:thioredoxin-like negative regulator of GroEL